MQNYQRIFRQLFLITTCFIFLSSKTFAQQDSCKLNWNYIKSYPSSSLHLITEPARWNWKQYLAATTISGAVFFLTTQDESITAWVLKNRNQDTKNIASFVKPLGNGAVLLGSAATIFCFAAITKHQQLKSFALKETKTLLITSAVLLAMKYSFQRARPYENLGSNVWRGPFAKSGFYSFPSGHSALSFATATTISQFSKKKIIPVIAYTIAASVALSRVHDEKHWSSDILAGATIGTAFALNINKDHK
jgi:membrane-associated phospholipid phosphatase